METINELQYQVNSFRGVIVSPGSLPDTRNALNKVLRGALDDWRRQKFASVWLEIPREKANLIPVAADLGFAYHHCV